MNEFLEFLKYLALGLVQGFTEPLPISSSGHMVIVDAIFGNVLSASAMNNFQIIVNLASLIAIIVYFRKRLGELIAGTWNYLFKGKKEEKPSFVYVLLIILATIPAGIIGLTIKILDLDTYYTNILVVGICLFITGLLMLLLVRFSKNATRETVTWQDALWMGGAQVIGLLPGISRSGVTSTCGVGNKLSLDKAFRFSFMMYIPASLAAAVMGIADLITEGGSGEPVFVPGYIGAFVASLIATYIAVSFFFKLIKNKNIRYFGYYCLIVSVIVLILIATGVFAW